MVRKVNGNTRSAAASSSASAADRLSEHARGEKHCCLGEGMGEDLHQSSAPADRAPGMRARGKGEHQKQIADLGYGRISDQQFEPRLSQRQDTAHDDGG